MKSMDIHRSEYIARLEDKLAKIEEIVDRGYSISRILEDIKDIIKDNEDGL